MNTLFLSLLLCSSALFGAAVDPTAHKVAKGSGSSSSSLSSAKLTEEYQYTSCHKDDHVEVHTYVSDVGTGEDAGKRGAEWFSRTLPWQIANGFTGLLKSQRGMAAQGMDYPITLDDVKGSIDRGLYTIDEDQFNKSCEARNFLNKLAQFKAIVLYKVDDSPAKKIVCYGSADPMTSQTFVPSYKIVDSGSSASTKTVTAVAPLSPETAAVIAALQSAYKKTAVHLDDRFEILVGASNAEGVSPDALGQDWFCRNLPWDFIRYFSDPTYSSDKEAPTLKDVQHKIEICFDDMMKLQMDQQKDSGGIGGGKLSQFEFIVRLLHGSPSGSVKVSGCADPETFQTFLPPFKVTTTEEE